MQHAAVFSGAGELVAMNHATVAMATVTFLWSPVAWIRSEQVPDSEPTLNGADKAGPFSRKAATGLAAKKAPMVVRSAPAGATSDGGIAFIGCPGLVDGLFDMGVTESRCSCWELWRTAWARFDSSPQQREWTAHLSGFAAEIGLGEQEIADAFDQCHEAGQQGPAQHKVNQTPAPGAEVELVQA